MQVHAFNTKEKGYNENRNKTNIFDTLRDVFNIYSNEKILDRCAC